jgi:hypothetical protein
MTAEDQIKAILLSKFTDKHVRSLLNHFVSAVEKYREGGWEGSIAKVGKFIEATLKAIWTHCGQTLPTSRQFKVGTIINQLAKLTSFDDSLRLLIPRACTFAYDISSNRGVRHDPDEIDPNKMDAMVVIPVASWVLAELVRYAAAGSSTPETTAELVDELVEKQFPLFENIDGRTYINATKLKAPEIGLLLLYAAYPKRIRRDNLIDQIARHGVKKNAAGVAVARMKNFVDDDNGNWKLRGTGRNRASEILSAINSRKN